MWWLHEGGTMMGKAAQETSTTSLGLWYVFFYCSFFFYLLLFSYQHDGTARDTGQQWWEDNGERWESGPRDVYDVSWALLCLFLLLLYFFTYFFLATNVMALQVTQDNNDWHEDEWGSRHDASRALVCSFFLLLSFFTKSLFFTGCIYHDHTTTNDTQPPPLARKHDVGVVYIEFGKGVCCHRVRE